MSVLLALVVGAFVVRLVVMSCRNLLDTAALQRANYRGRRVMTAAGLYAVLAVILVEAGRSLLVALDIVDESGSDHLARLLIMLAVVGFGLLGLVDDLLGGEDRGFRGHFRALAQGRMTTGLLKVVGVTAISIAIVGTGSGVSGVAFLADAAVIALAANLANLLDRAPGRTMKVAVVAYVPLAVIAGADAIGVAIAPVIGAFGGLFGDELRERVMLGDTGVYALGGALGVAAAVELGPGARDAVLAVLVALTLVAEFVSFSSVIARVAPLRWFDALGRTTA
jgi:UDP-N-acetylmuramyl pentapeptide phosphotransferase/UDP-N-acetylglucosamine-1-phosphate transferase